MTAILFALLAAALYAINIPFSKILLTSVAPVWMAALLYFGAGIGMLLCRALLPGGGRGNRLTKRELPFTLGMIVLDVIAPICLMLGLRSASSANASLLNNFEIVATALIALLFFREAVSKRMWLAILFIVASSALLSFEGAESLRFSAGSLFILLACVCWGLENNCTRMLSEKSTFEIVVLKGVFSGLGSALVAYLAGEPFPALPNAAWVLLLGFVSYGLSIFFYVKAQSKLGAAKTSAYYAVNPFIGALLSFLIFREPLSGAYAVALLVMLVGTALAVSDTLRPEARKA